MSEELWNQDASTQEDLSDQYLTFYVGEQVYAIPIIYVVEIVRMLPITAIPELPHYAKGVINLRGRVVPVIDVGLRFGRPPREYAERTCIIILQLEQTQVGLIVDEVKEVHTIPAADVEKPPAISNGGGAYITGVGKLDDDLALLLDAHRLLHDDLGALGSVYRG